MKIRNRKEFIEIVNRVPKTILKNYDEPNTKDKLITPIIREILKYRIETDEVEKEFKVHKDGDKKIDYILKFQDEAFIGVEAKRIKTKLDKHRIQLISYMAMNHLIKIGILTNGKIWEFYKRDKNGNISPEPFHTIDIENITYKDEKILKSLNKNNINMDVINNIDKIGEVSKEDMIKLNKLIKEIQEKNGINEDFEIFEQYADFKETEKKINIQSTLETKKDESKTINNKEEEIIKRKGINLKKLAENHKCITEVKDKYKKILYNKVVNEIESKFPDVIFDQKKHSDNIRNKNTDTIAGSISPIYSGIRMYINVEKIDDPKNLTSNKTQNGKKIKPKGVSKHGYGQYYYTIKNEKDIDYAIFLINQGYNQ